MNKNRKAEAVNFGSKTNDYFADNQKAFSSSDYSGELESVQSIIETMILPKPKAIRLYRCFACNSNYTARKFSNALILCRPCYRQIDGKGRVARRNLIDKTLNNIHRFLRARIETI